MRLLKWRGKGIPPSKIIIDKQTLNRLAMHSAECIPNEACGILHGIIKQDTYIVQDVTFVENIAKSPIQFSISNEDTIQAYDNSMDVVGIYHSHPASLAIPSETDREYMHVNPVAWVIHSGVDHTFRAWYMDDDMHEIAIQTENTA